VQDTKGNGPQRRSADAVDRVYAGALDAYLAADHLAPFAERLCALRAVAVDNVGTRKSQFAK
jgi:hypothetical protein